ncbi:zinc-dependent metalloprotease [Actinotalea sp. M2MS4P-6]|uniref:zinc-dependent metalloprotease n=1 Tax=Actinotalea sp. M2MS4P-6 TaxID=2983762 RepID=UPI0021E36F25|nr:zinc-dependent metalloprotease [Actinotalea sp. M2MS4P-6]MCV2394510.1 zinc-dependent metalloprotease [Actinotalea sp. M2MS4P-6]
MSEPGIPPSWEALLRQLLGPQADEVIAEISERGLIGPDGTPMDLAQLASSLGLPDDPVLVQSMVAQFQAMLASGTGPVNADLSHDVARQAAVSEGDPTVTEGERRAVADALGVAELWLDQATDLPAAGGPVRALSRSEWVEQTMPRWRTLAEPVAGSVASALATVMTDQQVPEEMSDLGQTMAPMMRQLGSAVFGLQLGNAVGTLSREVLGTTDIGIPLIAGPGAALLPRNVAEFAEGLDVPLDEVRLFLALREAAHARLFTHVGWLQGHLLGVVETYARGVEIDLDAIEEAVRSIDPSDPQNIADAMSGGVFSLETTPAQQAALLRLETVLALVEGWVDEVTAAAASTHLPHTAALREMMRRRRAAGGPAEDIFATLVGLELRPRRSRDAARLWATLTEDGGIAAREAVWDHPDLLPTPEDLDDPAGYRGRREAAAVDSADLDRALAEIFGEGTTDGPDDPDDPEESRP